MTKQSSTEPKADAAKMRRDYLWRTAIVGIRVRIYTNLGVMLWVAAVLTCPLDLVLLVRASVPGYSTSWLSAGIWTTVTVLCGAAGYAFTRMAETSRRYARTLEYVPPVAEQISALSATDILVRGSEPPTAVPEVLLRAARAGAETDAGELLRTTVTAESEEK